MKKILLLIVAMGVLMGAISCSDDDEPKRGNGVFTVNTPMINHLYNTGNGAVMGFSSTHNKLTLDTVKHKASLELNYNDGQGDKLIKLDDLTATPKRLGFYELRSASNNTFSGYVDFNESAMRYVYTTSDGIRVISMTPEVFFLKTTTTVTYDDTTKSNTDEFSMYQFNVMPATSSATVKVMQIVHSKDRKYFNSITASSVPVTATANGFTINATDLNTTAVYVLHYTDSLGSTKSTTDKYPFKRFNATIDLANDNMNADFMIDSSATVTATGRTYPDYTAY